MPHRVDISGKLSTFRVQSRHRPVFLYMIPFLKKYFSSLYIPIVWTLIIAILLCLPGKMLPNETGFRIPNFDKLVHMGLFGGFVFLWGLHMTRRTSDHQALLRAFFIFYIIANFFGYSMELVQ